LGRCNDSNATGGAEVIGVGELKILLWYCAGINYAILFLWFFLFVFGHDALYRLHRRWFRIPVDTFDSINYAAMAIFKSGIILFNLVPLAALYFAM
jgi:hypothetical protein